VAAHTIAVGLKYDGIAVKSPPGIIVKISSPGKIGLLSALGINQHNVIVRLMLIRVEESDYPPAVRAPMVVCIKATRIYAATISQRLGFTRGYIHNHDGVAVLEIDDFLAVWRIFRASAVNAVRLEQGTLVDYSGIGEIGVFVTRYRRFIDVPRAVTLRGVQQLTSFWMP